MNQETTQLAPTPQTPKDRATEFQAVDANAVSMSGEVLLVQAYVVLWLLLFFAIAWMWRRQSKLDAQLHRIDQALDREASARGRSAQPEDHAGR